MKKYSNTFRIDGTKLQKLITKRGLTQVEVSAGIHRSRGFIKNCIANGTMTEPNALLLEQMFNIKRADYEYIELMPEQVIEQKEEKPKEDNFDWERLYNTIYDAVYAALTKSKEDFKRNTYA